MKMFLTRLGFGAKMIVTGDITQIDLPRGQHSGLVNVREVLASIPDIAFVYFDSQDVVRHKLVQDIVSAYKQHGEQHQPARKATSRGPGEQASRRPGERPRRPTRERRDHLMDQIPLLAARAAGRLREWIDGSKPARVSNWSAGLLVSSASPSSSARPTSRAARFRRRRAGSPFGRRAARRSRSSTVRPPRA